MNVIGIDLGGTTIKGGRVENGVVVDSFSLPTRAQQGGDVTMGVLKDVIAALITPQTVAIGIGVPSVVDRQNGIVYNVQNISNWDVVPMKDVLMAEFGVPVHIDNDANCYAFGEKIFGVCRDIDDFVGVTLGTGVGSGIVKDGKLISDANCGSGEFCEIPYEGRKLEDFCGSHFFALNDTTGAELAERAAAGDSQALELFSEYGRHLSHLVRIIMLVLDPKAIVFGGAIARSFRYFHKSIIDNLSDFPYPRSVEKIKILTSELQNAGILGAASLCSSEMQQDIH